LPQGWLYLHNVVDVGGVIPVHVYAGENQLIIIIIFYYFELQSRLIFMRFRLQLHL
jgi:hypothetical protein